jgi:predicted DNA-binding transcriptional regulator YafY
MNPPMKFFEHLNLLRQMHQLIRLKATGTPRDFAKRVKMPESTFFRRLDDLKSLGGEIYYNPERHHYEYLNDSDKTVESYLKF